VRLCESVALLADVVAAEYDSRSEWEDLLLHLLRSAPIYRDARRLDAWDMAFVQARGDKEAASPFVELVDAVADVATFNLYGAFDVPGTQRVLDRVVQLMQAKGISAMPVSDLSDW
jgi:hypothetical protein